MDKTRADVLLTGMMTIALATLVLYEFWQVCSVGSIDLFGRMNGWSKLTYSEHPNGVLLVLAIYTGMLAYCTILSVRAMLSQRADNN